MGRTPSRLARLLLSLGALVAACLAAEVAFRMAGLGDPTSAEDILVSWEPGSPFSMVDDPELAWELQPRWRGHQVYRRAADGRELRRVPVRTNALGMRGPELEARTAGGRGRLLLLGDSVAFGQGLPEEQTIAARLGAALPETEVVAAAVPGWSLRQEVRWLSRNSTKVQPDRVVVLLYVNDLQPVYLRPDDQPSHKRAPEWARATGLRRYSHVINLLVGARERRRAFADWQQGVSGPDHDPAPSKSYLDQLRRESTPQLADQELRRLAATCADLGLPCTVALLPGLIAVGSDRGEDLVELLAEATTRARLPLIRLDGALAQVPQAERYVFPGDQHPSEGSAAALARTLAVALQADP